MEQLIGMLRGGATGSAIALAVPRLGALIGVT
jgi:hypothetical protein